MYLDMNIVSSLRYKTYEKFKKVSCQSRIKTTRVNMVVTPFQLLY